jgi:hypothetical protein
LQFIGPPSDVVEALTNYQQGYGHLLSGYAGGNRFEYDLEATHLEPRAGQAGCGCKHGMHFFRDIDSAFRHYGQIPAVNKGKAAIIVAKRLTQGRGLVCDIESEQSLQQQYGKVKCVECDGGEASSAASSTASTSSSSSTSDQRVRRLLSFANAVFAASATSAASSNNSSSTASTAMLRLSGGAGDSGGESDGEGKEDKECPICMRRGTVRQPLVSLGCHYTHVFHEVCMLGHRACPICRTPIKK